MNTEDIISVCNIFERVEDLEADLDQCPDNFSFDDGAELNALRAILADLKGNGGDEQWRGDWYPSTLIRESYFKDYAQELAEDIGAIDPKASWPMTCIDWDQAAHELRYDYTNTEIDGITYFYR